MLSDIKAVIYDMDGVLINSEPLWRRAMIQSFGEIGIPFTDDDCKLTTGMRFIEVARFWLHRFNRHDISVMEFNDLVINRLRELIYAEGEPMTGVLDSIHYFKNKGMKLALGTSSSNMLVEAVLQKLQIGEHFQAVCSAETMKYGKPHPEVFLHCAEQLEILPTSCLVIEDSLNGIIAAKAAQMKVLAVPDEYNLQSPKFAIADHMYPSLSHFLANA
ncbi:MAG: hexitol phosphatase HxpB [Bacteroidetes bacterium]|nr:hexitol phosphatase HxpB [Bacteroidota bacterium]